MSALRDDRVDGGILYRQVSDAPVVLSDGLVRYRFSTSERARDGFVVRTNGWKLDEFRKNPQFLFAHKADEFPIGRVEQIQIVGDELQGSVRFATHPVAQVARQLVVDGFMPAVSVGFRPLEWDRTQPDVISRAELLECSAVPVGALPSALVRALSVRAGRVLSAQNEGELRAAHQQISDGHQMIAAGMDRMLAVCDQASGAEPQDPADNQEDAAAAARRVAATTRRDAVRRDNLIFRAKEAEEKLEALIRQEHRRTELGRMGEAGRRALAASRRADFL